MYILLLDCLFHVCIITLHNHFVQTQAIFVINSTEDKNISCS